MSNVPTSNLTALYNNTTPSTTAEPAAVDNAIIDIVATINGNSDAVNTLISAGTLSRLGIINVSDYNASGLATTATGSITTGTKVLTLTTTPDFVAGHGINLQGAFELATLVIADAATSSANCTVTLNGVAFTVALTSGATAAEVATAIRAGTFTGWTAGGTALSTTVTFTSNTTGTKTDASYTVGTTGATGTMTTTTQGTSDQISTVASVSGLVVNISDNSTRTIAAGTISHEDTVATQAAIDVVSANGGGTIVFPFGTYLITSVDLIPGISYIGYGATIKRPASAGNWVRTLTTDRVQYAVNDVDSAPIIISGLILDGNRVNQGPYEAYELEQSHLIFVAADPAYSGRVRVIIENCLVKENVADGISLYKNCDVKVSNCFAWNCWRGGIVSTGGYARVQIENCNADGDVHPSGIDLETDGAGYGSSLRTEFMVNNLYVKGDFDVGISEGSIFMGNNIIVDSPSFNMSGVDSTIRITNSKFHIGVESSTNNRIVRPKDTIFENCIFVCDGIANDGDPTNYIYSALNIYFQGTTTTNQKLQLINCKFYAENVKAGDTVRGISIQADKREWNNVLVVENCTFENTLDTGIYMPQGGTVKVRNSTFNCDEPMRFKYAGTYYFDIDLQNIMLGGSFTKYINLGDGHASSTLKQNLILDEAQNIIDDAVATWVNSLFIGRRIIYGTAAPTAATHGMKNDIYRLKNPVLSSAYEWICTTSGAGAGAVWKVVLTLPA